MSSPACFFGNIARLPYLTLHIYYKVLSDMEYCLSHTVANHGAVFASRRLNSDACIIVHCNMFTY